jgi:myo-inositol catabolism protein IolH
MDHKRSNGLRYITNPPGNPIRVHQHLKIGDGDVNWSEFFAGLNEIGFLDNPKAVMCSSVFAENESNKETAKFQISTINEYLHQLNKN